MGERARGGFGFSFGPARSARERNPLDAMRILVMGDFSGREGRGEVEGGPAIAGRETYSLEIDEFERVMERMGASILDPLAPPEDALPIEFRSLEDFHPDRLVRRVESFGRLRSIRRRLEEASGFDGAARDLAEVLGFDPCALGATPRRSEKALGGTPIFAEEQRTDAATQHVEAFVRSVVGPHVVEGADARRGAGARAADAALSALMRRLMHTPSFKTLESNWRGVHRLITSVEIGDRLRVHLLDVSRDEMIVDLAEATRAGGLVHSGLYKQLVESTAFASEGGGWGLLVGCFTFERAVGDAVLLNGLAQLAAAAGAPLLAAAGASMVGCESFADGADPDGWLFPEDQASHAAGKAWEMARAMEEARYVALGMPRVLVRTPYGTGGDAADAFGFEELPRTEDGGSREEWRTRHEAYLWGNPALTMAEVLAALYLQDGWAMDPAAAAEVIGLPTHSFPGASREGEKLVMPCAEAWLTQRGAAAMRGVGVTPLLSIRGRDGVQAPGIHAWGNGGGPLAGRWE